MKVAPMRPQGRQASPAYRSIMKKGHVVTLPPELETFRLGQRVYFHADARGILTQAKPRRVTGGRLLSSRVRRGIRTLAAFGPRASGARRRVPDRAWSVQR